VVQIACILHKVVQIACIQHKFQFNDIFSIFTTHNTLRSKFRSRGFVFYASDPYVGIFRMPDDGF
jgi:hypothetical protein